MYDQKPTTTLMEDLEVLGLLSDGQREALKRKRLAENTGADPMAPDAPPAKPPHAEPDGDEAPGAGTPAPPPPAPPADDDAAKGPESYDDELANYEAAWDVVKQYYALSESNEKLSESEFRTVINAMAYIIETQGKYMGPDLMDKDPDELPGGHQPKWVGKPENNPEGVVKGTGALERAKDYKYHLASPKPGEKAESLDRLVNELKSLTSSAKTEDEDEMQELGAKIIEGFEAIRDTAQGVAEQIASDLKESNERVTPDHPGYKLGKYFEGVATDARMLLKVIAERDTTDVDDAIEDLNSLSRDLKKGLQALNN